MSTKFFISFYERTGSTMLCHILNQHPKIKCYFELLATDLERIKNRKEYPKDEALYRILEIYQDHTKHEAKGFKFKFPNQHCYYDEVTKYLYSNADYKIIFLYRKNVIKNYVSKINQLQLLSQHNLANIEESVNLPKILFDKEKKIMFTYKILDYILNTTLIYNQIKKRNNYIVIAYEDLVFDTSNTISKVCDFLNVDFNNDMVESFKTLKISNDDILSNFVNPIQFENFVNETHMAPFLKEDISIESWPDIGQKPYFELLSAMP